MADKQDVIVANPEKVATEPVDLKKALGTEVAVVKNTDFSVNPYTDKEAFNNLYIVAKQLASSDIVPQNYQNKPTNCMIALEVANRMNTDTTEAT